MTPIETQINHALQLGNSIAKYVIGFYYSQGSSITPTLKVPVFCVEGGFENLKPYEIAKVLIECHGSVQWINVLVKNIQIDSTGECSDKMIGRLLQYELEALKNFKTVCNI